MKKKITPYLISLIIMCLFSCTKVEAPAYDNPYDPLNPNIQLPKAEIINSISNGMTINNSSVIIYWKGVYTNSEFAYKLDGVDEQFTNWTSDKQAAYNYLDEGTFIFYVKERPITGTEQHEATSVTFTVDAVTTCGLLLNKMYTKVNKDSTFFVDLNIEEVKNIKGLTTTLSFDNTSMQLTEINKLDSEFYANSDTETLITNTIEEANNSGEIEINLLLLGGTNNGFSGNSPVCRLIFNPKLATQTEINFIGNKTNLRDYNNNNITCNIFREGIVDIYSTY